MEKNREKASQQQPDYNPFADSDQVISSTQSQGRRDISVTASFTYYSRLWQNTNGDDFRKCHALLEDYIGGEGMLAELKAFLQHPNRHYKDEVRVILARVRRGEFFTAEQLVQEITKICQNHPHMNKNGDFFGLESAVFEHHLKR